MTKIEQWIVKIHQSKGFEKFDELGNPLVMKLKKALYKLKRSGQMWNKLLHEFLTSNKFIQSKSDYCVYIQDVGQDRVATSADMGG